MKGRDLRNEILNKLKPLLWHGLTDKAIGFLLEIPEKDIKSAQSLEKLIAYLKRNRPYIPCYAARKELGLCNASAVGEKMNDLIVSERQKNNGMSWTKKRLNRTGRNFLCLLYQKNVKFFLLTYLKKLKDSKVV